MLVVLLVHAALLAWLFVRAREGSLFELETGAFASVAAGALAIAGWLLWRWPHRTRVIAVLGGVITIAMLFTFGSLATVSLMLLNAYVVGRLVSRPLGASASNEPPSVTALVGIALWTGFMAAMISFKVHYPAVYVVMLLLPVVAVPHVTAEAVVRISRSLARNDTFSARERAWIAVVVALGIIHALLAARPEVGFDAGTMHLQFAQILRHENRWPFDTSRYAWAVMPLGADLQFAAAFLLDGEHAVRLLNLAFAALVGDLAYRLIRLYARREIALACVALLASTPLAFLETGTLFVENLWTAFLLASFYATLRFARIRGAADATAAALCAAGAMQCKVIGVAWVIPVLAGLAIVMFQRRDSMFTRPLAIWAVIAAFIAVWPYANAWLRTGNPLFPYFNALFRSPLFDVASSFNNALYNTPLRPWSPYAAVLDSAHHVEGSDGAAGLQWLLFYPLVLFGALRRPPPAFWYALALAVVFFAAVYSQQSYLRYLLPFFVLVTVLAGWTIETLSRTRAAGMTLLAAGTVVCALNVSVIHTASWINTTLCLPCTHDDGARDRFIARYAPLRTVSDYLNRELPDARIGFLILNGASPSGYLGSSHSANWHDWSTYHALVNAAVAEDVAAVVRRHGLTHVVVATAQSDSTSDAIRAYVAQRTSPVWKFDNFVVAAVRGE